MEMNQITSKISAYIFFGIVSIAVLGLFQTIFIPSQSIIQTVFSATVSSTLVVGNAAPAVTAVTVNGASAITLSPNATTAVSVSYQVSDSNGCTDVFASGTLSILLYRSSITSSSCNGAQSNMNCYKVTTSTNNCLSATSTSANATSTFHVYYFADPTDPSSTYSAQTWLATAIATDSANATGSADSSGVELNTLVAVNVTTSSINYGTVTGGTNTGAVNQTATTTNAGNVTTTLQLSALSTLTNGGNIIETSSQRYSTSSFTYPGTSTPLTGSAVTVGGVTLVQPTSTSFVDRATFWGVSVSSSFPTGTYSGVTTFAGLFVP